ncbi:MAG: hypothetical protein AAFV88_08515 [Planctomycetota bacterium]
MRKLSRNSPLTVVISAEGLATASLGCYGCSWNETPAIDRLASGGVVWDRWTATTDQPTGLITDWLKKLSQQEIAKRSLLITDEPALETVDIKIYKRQVLERSGELVFQEDIQNTAFGRLFSEADRQLSRETSLLWIHTAAIRDLWDAPRNIEPDLVMREPQEEQVGEEPEEEKVAFQLPPTTMPPRHQRNHDDHPDLVFAWMQRYAEVIQLLDDLIAWSTEAWESRRPTFVVAGTSGFALGENGWIGHRLGPLRSCDIRLPLIVSGGGPIRVGELQGASAFCSILNRVVHREEVVTPESWCAPAEDKLVSTASDRAERAITTQSWFWVRDPIKPETLPEDRLFLKPDDQFDINDVSRLRPDVIDSLEASSQESV